jgi:hypothetical protein
MSRNRCRCAFPAGTPAIGARTAPLLFARMARGDPQRARRARFTHI